MNDEYKFITSRLINSFGSYSQFWADYYYKSYRDANKMFYRLKARMRYVNTTGGGTGTYQDQVNVQFRINVDSNPNYNVTKTLKGTTYNAFSNGAYWEAESDLFSFDKIDGKTKCQININNAITSGFDSPNYEFELDIVKTLAFIKINNGQLVTVDAEENVGVAIPVELTKYNEEDLISLKLSIEVSDDSDRIQLGERESFNASSITLTEDELKKIYGALQTTSFFRFYCTVETYKDGSKFGETETMVSACILIQPPTIKTTFTETNSKVVSVLGTSADTIVQNASKVEVTVLPTAHKQASITQVQILHNSILTTLVKEPYEQTFTALSNIFDVTVTDSRGIPSNEKYTKNIIEYQPIKINNVDFERYSMTSSNIVLNASITYRQVNFNKTPNVPTISYRRGKSGEIKTLQSSDYTIDAENNLIKIDNLILENVIDYKESDVMYLLVSDLLTEDEDNKDVHNGVPLWDEGEHDVQFNCDVFIADENRENKVKVATLNDIPKDKYDVKIFELGEVAGNKIFSDVEIGLEKEKIVCISALGISSDGSMIALGYNSNATSGYFSLQINAENHFYVATSYSFTNLKVYVLYEK